MTLTAAKERAVAAIERRGLRVIQHFDRLVTLADRADRARGKEARRATHRAVWDAIDALPCRQRDELLRLALARVARLESLLAELDHPPLITPLTGEPRV